MDNHKASMYFSVKSNHVFYDVRKTGFRRSNSVIFKMHIFIFSLCIYVSFLFQNWHKACFHCEVCKMVLTANNFISHQKMPYCKVYVLESFFAWIFFLVTIKAQCFNKSGFIFHCFMTKGIICLSAQLMWMWCKCAKYWLIYLISNRHNPKNNTFTSVYATPVNINAKKQSEAVSEVRWQTYCISDKIL